jgi:hypothetical protein
VELNRESFWRNRDSLEDNSEFYLGAGKASRDSRKLSRLLGDITEGISDLALAYLMKKIQSGVSLSLDHKHHHRKRPAAASCGCVSGCPVCPV